MKKRAKKLLDFVLDYDPKNKDNFLDFDYSKSRNAITIVAFYKENGELTNKSYFVYTFTEDKEINDIINELKKY